MGRKKMVILLVIVWTVAVAMAMFRGVDVHFCACAGTLTEPSDWGFWGSPEPDCDNDCAITLSRFGVYAPDSAYQQRGLTPPDVPPFHVDPALRDAAGLFLAASLLTIAVLAARHRAKRDEHADLETHLEAGGGSGRDGSV